MQNCTKMCKLHIYPYLRPSLLSFFPGGTVHLRLATLLIKSANCTRLNCTLYNAQEFLPIPFHFQSDFIIEGHNTSRNRTLSRVAFSLTCLFHSPVILSKPLLSLLILRIPFTCLGPLPYQTTSQGFVKILLH